MLTFIIGIIFLIFPIGFPTEPLHKTHKSQQYYKKRLPEALEVNAKDMDILYSHCVCVKL